MMNKILLAFLVLASTALADTATPALGSKVTIVVTASGTLPFSYQWVKDGKGITGATSDRIVIENFQNADAGSYVCRVSNAAGSATSDAGILKLVAIAPSNAKTSILLEPATLPISK